MSGLDDVKAAVHNCVRLAELEAEETEKDFIAGNHEAYDFLKSLGVDGDFSVPVNTDYSSDEHRRFNNLRHALNYGNRFHKKAPRGLVVDGPRKAWSVITRIYQDRVEQTIHSALDPSIEITNIPQQGPVYAVGKLNEKIEGLLSRMAIPVFNIRPEETELNWILDILFSSKDNILSKSGNEFLGYEMLLNEGDIVCPMLIRLYQSPDGYYKRNGSRVTFEVSDEYIKNKPYLLARFRTDIVRELTKQIKAL